MVKGFSIHAGPLSTITFLCWRTWRNWNEFLAFDMRNKLYLLFDFHETFSNAFEIHAGQQEKYCT